MVILMFASNSSLLKIKVKRKKCIINLAGPTLGTTDLGSNHISLKTYLAKKLVVIGLQKRHAGVAMV